jgi:hypothetical protein
MELVDFTKYFVINLSLSDKRAGSRDGGFQTSSVTYTTVMLTV